MRPLVRFAFLLRSTARRRLAPTRRGDFGRRRPLTLLPPLRHRGLLWGRASAVTFGGIGGRVVATAHRHDFDFTTDMLAMLKGHGEEW